MTSRVTTGLKCHAGAWAAFQSAPLSVLNAPVSALPSRTFRPQQRLLRGEDFSQVLAARRARGNAWFLVCCLPQAAGQSPDLPTAPQPARLGLIVSKKIDARAVGRNRIKRLVREVFRQHAALRAAPCDWVVRARRRLPRTQMAQARAALLALLHLPPPRVRQETGR